MASKAAGEPEPPPPANTRLQAQRVQQQQALAQHQPRGEAEATFLAAIDHIFARWTLLRLAVDMGWGNGDGNRNIQLLKEDCLVWLQKRRATSAEPSELEEILADYINDFFHVIAEDGSPREVANLICQLYQQCATGDLTMATHVLSLPLPGAPVTETCQAAPEPDELHGDMSDGDDDDDDVEGGGGGGGGSFGVGAIPPSSSAAMPPVMEDEEAAPPLVDADGWSSVKPKGRKGR
jgi:pre-rRNA-processing protein TSR2